MPVLKREKEIFPAGLFDLPEPDFPWWVAHTQSRQEKALARYLEPRGVPFYLPQSERRKRRAGRTFVSYLPLFPGYVFFRGSKADRYAAWQSNLLVRILEVQDQALLTQELWQLRELQRSGASLVPCVPVRAGDVVRVAEGPFKGYTGVVVREQARLRFVVSISVLRKSVAVEFEREVLSPVFSSPRPSELAKGAVA